MKFKRWYCWRFRNLAPASCFMSSPFLKTIDLPAVIYENSSWKKSFPGCDIRNRFNHMKPRFQNPPILPTSSGSTGQQLSVRKLNTLTCSNGFPWKSLKPPFFKEKMKASFWIMRNLTYYKMVVPTPTYKKWLDFQGLFTLEIFRHLLGVKEFPSSHDFTTKLRGSLNPSYVFYIGNGTSQKLVVEEFVVGEVWSSLPRYICFVFTYLYMFI